MLGMDILACQEYNLHHFIIHDPCPNELTPVG